MTGATTAQLLGPLLFLVFVLGTDLWVLRDARARQAEGRPVVPALGGLRIDSPVAWFAAGLLVWGVFTPLYLVNRG